MKVKINDLDIHNLQSVKSANIEKAKQFYKSKPFSTKVYLAMKLKMPLSFLHANWEEITK